MSATVHTFISLVREHRLPCPCRDGVTCYTHRCEDLAAVIREMRDEDLDALFIAVDKHRAALDLVLEVLDGITGAETAHKPSRSTQEVQ